MAARRGRRPDRGAVGLEALEEALGHQFKDRQRLERALVHRSWAHEQSRAGEDNERMEFLGDAILALGVSGMLVERFKGEEVGELSRTRAYLVSEANLARKARSLDLGRHLRLGKGEERGGGREKDSLLADTYEAVLAAIVMDAGLDAALATIERQFRSQVAGLKPGARTAQDHKTDLQEALQAVGLPVPEYRVTRESGPDHRKSFGVELTIVGKAVARGSGRSKKAAEQMAARRALREIKDLIPKLTEGGAPARPSRP